MDLTNKSVLLTQLRLSDFTGSEIITLELAEYFSKRAKNVFIATTTYDNPIKTEFENLNNITVFNINDEKLNEVIREEGVDLAWIHHQMIPDALLESPSNTKFVFHHMSPYTNYETPFVPEIERVLADKILLNSEETKDSFIERGLMPEGAVGEVFNNAAPDEFDQTSDQSKVLKSVLVVSNHVPEEMSQALELLRENDIRVTTFGVRDDTYQRLTAQDVLDHDVIISIGKTVQYSLLARRPVYCYDRFGGPGYLNEDNFATAEKLNFSGRGFDSKEPNQIVEEIITHYDSAKKSILTLYESHRDRFSLSYRIEKVLDEINRQNDDKVLDPVEVIRYKNLRDMIFTPQTSIRRIDNLEREIAQKNTKIKELEAVAGDLKHFRYAYQDVTSSISYKVGKLVSLPLRIPRRLYRELRSVVSARRHKKWLMNHIRDIYGHTDPSKSKIRTDIIIRSDAHPTSSTFIRLVSPFSYDKVSSYTDYRLLNGEHLSLDRPAGVYIVQRTALAHLEDAKKLVEHARKTNTKLFVDTDDAFGELDEHHPQYALQKERVDALNYVMEHADETWFSTEKLRDLYRLKRSKVVRNTLDTKVWKRLSEKSITPPGGNVPLRMVYMGTITHDADFAMIIPALKRLHEGYEGQFELHVIGVARQHDEYPWMIQHEPDSALYPDFVRWFNELPQFDIGLSPLEDSSFNRSKSDIKCLDYLACGIRPVVSNTEAYLNPELDGLIKRVENTTDAWYGAFVAELENLTDTRKKMQTQAERGFDYILQHRSTSHAAESIVKSLTTNHRKNENE